MAEEKKADDSEKIKSVYSLNSNDNPGNLITQVQLKGENYDEWARAVRTALRAKKKYGFIDGTVKKPDESSPNLEDWWTVNSMLVSWIFNTIEPTLRSTITLMENAKDLWEDIKQRFAIGNGPRVQQLRFELANCRQNGQAIVAYYGRLKSLWDELNNYDQIPLCSCAGCSCNITAALERKREEERTHQFLMGLDEDGYGTVRSNILSTEPLPSLNRVYATIVQQERVRTMTRETEEKGHPMSFAVQTGNRNFGINTKEKKGICSLCKKEGHEADSCFQIIGYPDWWGDRPRTSRNGRGSGQGHGNQKTIGNFGRGRGGNPRANASKVIGAENTRTTINDSDRTGLRGLNDEQWGVLLNLLNSNKDTSNEQLMGKSILLPWIFDTGASHHMTGVYKCLSNVRDIDPWPVGLPNGEEAMALKEGSVLLGGKLKLENVLFVPNLKCSLISVSQLLRDSDYIVQFTHKLCAIQDRVTRMLIGAGEQREGLYFFKGAVSVYACKISGIQSFELWHRRLGHPSSKITRLLPCLNDFNKCNQNKVCDICLRAKQTREPFFASNSIANASFDLIHCDVWGPYRTNAHCGARYFLTIVDDFSRGVWIYLLKGKHEVASILKKYFAMISRQFNKKVKIVRSDNGTEFTCLKDYFDENGMLHETTIVGTSQQNGRVERKHRHILNVARALRFQANLPIEFWGDCVLTSCYLINRTPSELLNGKTPYEILFGKQPGYKHIRIFGCLCYAHIQNKSGDKFASRSRKCVFVGYPYGKKGWKVYDMETSEYLVSRDVIFDESEFPFMGTNEPIIDRSATSPRYASPEAITDDDLNITNIRGVVNDSHEEPTLSEDDDKENGKIEESSTHDMGGVDDLRVTNDASEAPYEVLLGRGLRVKQKSTRLKDYVSHTIKISPSAGSFVQPKSSGTPFPIAHYVNCDKFSVQHRSFLAAITSQQEPCSYAQAVKITEWREAMRCEVQALEENGTWTVEDLPPGKKALGCMWVYKLKYNSDGTIERHKARLVVFGNKQVEGIDYNETFAPTAKVVTVRTFLAIAAAKNWELHQMDVHNAFLHGDLDEEVYMKLPPGFSTTQPGKVCRLRKSLYGLKQAPRCWFAKLGAALKKYGFQQSSADYSLFTYNKEEVNMSILVYVDDLIISGNNSASVRAFKDYLSQCFHMKDLGKLKYFLGIEVARNDEGIFLCQRKYALDIISEVGLLGCKPASIPLEQNHRLALVKGPEMVNPSQYRRLVGRLIYLTFTRPELSYCVHTLAQFMQEPLEAHWQAALRVVRYLKTNPGQGILLHSNCDLKLRAYCDSDWAGCPLTRRSLTGFFVFLGHSPVSWKTKKQHTVSRSSAEAEYRSMATTTCELKWLKSLLLSLGVAHSGPMSLHCDSQAALHIAANPVFHERTKHIEVDCHFVRKEIQTGNIQPSYVHTSQQLADIFTKALGKRQFDHILSKLGTFHPHAPT